MTEESYEPESPIETHADWALRKRREKMIVTRFQAKTVLMQRGLLDSVETIIQGSADPLIKMAWQEAGFERLSPFVGALASELGLGAEEVDDMFDAAKLVR